MTDPDTRGPIDVGDRVTARHHLGGVLRPTVRRGHPGIVTLRTGNGTLHVAFTDGPTLALDPDDVTFARPNPSA